MSDGAAEAGATRRARPGDIGRRVAHRREQLGLSREEAARRAGIAPAYLRYLEEHPAEVEGGTLTRLAGALGTTAGALRGGGMDAPPGLGRAVRHAALLDLEPEECWQRLGTHGVGRIVFCGAAEPTAVPVNYAVVEGTIVYRTAPGSTPAAAAGQRAAFEVDRVDEALSQGWSVLAVGRCEQVTDPAEVRGLAERVSPEPWAGGGRDLWIRVVPDRISGRRIRTP